MNRRHLFVVGGIIVLGLLLAYPLSRMFDGSSERLARPSIGSLGGRTQIRRTDSNGEEWVINRVGRRLAPVDANGAPVQPTIVVKTDVFRAGGREVLIGLVLEGKDGTRYQSVVTKGGTRLPAPKLRIVNEAGEALFNDSFRYG